MKRSSLWSWLIGAVAVALAACGGSNGAGKPAENALIDQKRLHLMGSGGGVHALVTQPPLHERGIEDLALIYRTEDFLHYARISAFYPRLHHNWVRSDPWISPSFGESLLLELAEEKAVIDVQSFTRTHRAIVDGMTRSAWPWTYGFDDNAKRLIDDLRKKGVDAILLIRERPLRSTGIFPILPGAKGIYGHSRIFAYAGFDDVLLIDPVSAEVMPYGSYQQASWKILAQVEVKKGGFESYSQEKKELIAESVEDRIRNNVEQILLVFKIIPIRGTEYMTLGDLDQTEMVSYEIPD